MADISTMQDLLKLQQEMKDRLVKKLEPTSLGKAAALKGYMADKAVDIGRAQEALDRAMKERDGVVKYWDDRIVRLKARVDVLTKDVKQAQDQAKQVKLEDTKPTTLASEAGAPTKKRPPRDG
jgi:hypothetical protein